jgi:protein ImuB
MRVACVFAPLFPLAARLRSEPNLRGEAVVLVEGNGNAARVVAASRPARRAGVDAGMTLPQARALVPKLLARARDRESERAAQEAMLEVADAFSPRVEDAGEGVMYLDLEGIPALRKDGERALGRDLIAAVEKTGLPARAGIASSKLAARVAAGLPDSPGVVPPGEEAKFLAPLPLARLSPEIGISETLGRWGLHSIGDFARLPPGEVESRLGSLGRRLHASAHGRDLRPLEPRLPALCLSEGLELEWPLVALEPFLFVGHAALERLTARLDGLGLACRRLELTMTLDPDGCDARAIALPAPTRDVKTLLTLVRLELEARPPGSPVVGFTFAAHPDKPRRAQLALFGPSALSPDRLATTIARLAALLGADRVVSPRAADGHRPERFASSGYEPPPPPEIARPPRAGRGLLAVRVLRPPVSLEVMESPGEPGGRPARVRSAHDATPEIAGSVRVAAGPWSMEEGWWSEAPAARDYWDVELAEGGLYRLYRDRASRAWFADGVYD